MRRNKKKRGGQGNRLRMFAWLMALTLALAGWGLGRTRLGLVLELTAALVFAVGTLWPGSFESLYRLVGPARKMAGKPS